MKTYRLTIKGLVQGIGFRPFIYNLAHSCAIRGQVRNRADAVEILVQGDEDTMRRFIARIEKEAPPLARIDTIQNDSVELPVFDGFSIVASEDASGAVTDVSPDIAVCEYCLQDMKTQKHRIGYPLVNCTLCGPRFSIVKAVPYDRSNTTMAPFTMCSTCKKEYMNPADRRFHAQPVACNSCGPEYVMYRSGKKITGNRDVLVTTAQLLSRGAIVAIKGIGGFHLSCDPFHAGAVARLREIKRRDGKPFALMFRTVEALREYASVNEQEKKLLRSPVHPIVLLRGNGRLPPEVNNHLPTIGAMLPSMPFHYQLFEQFAGPALVMTSGNLSSEPIIIDDHKAVLTFNGITDAVTTYTRAVHNRVDDSVCAVYAGTIQILRRSRGFAPSPVPVGLPVDGIAATGAELKNCFALGKDSRVIMSQHLGDLKNAETLLFYEEAFERLCDLFRVTPGMIVHDMHPDYLSTRFARESGLPTVAVQHHYAHIAGCCVEHTLNEQVIGIALDGTGYGDDGRIWGGEFLIAGPAGYERFAHLRYVGMPGGDKAAVEPWRMAASYLYDTFGDEYITSCREYFSEVSEEQLLLLNTAMRKGINTIDTSSTGRLFDAVAALCGVCSIMTFEAEAAMRLEALCEDPLLVEPFSWCFENDQIDVRPMIREIIDLRARGDGLTVIATRFHATVIAIIVTICRAMRDKTGIDKVILSGGCFQNRYILEGSLQRLKENSFSVFLHQHVPCNDGGIALGQIVVAAWRKQRGEE